MSATKAGSQERKMKERKKPEDFVFGKMIGLKLSEWGQMGVKRMPGTSG